MVNMPDRHIVGYGIDESIADTPAAAVVLDMVGAPGARFHREAFSDHYARQLVDRVWTAARAAGYADRFPDEGGARQNCVRLVKVMS